jgi:hypothetical protein
MPKRRALSRLYPGGNDGRARLDAIPWRLQYKRVHTQDCVSDDDSDDESMTLSTSQPPTKERNATDDCHVLIRWSQLQNLVKNRMSCSYCGLAVTSFKRWTVGVATEVDFFCSACKVSDTVGAL